MRKPRSLTGLTATAFVAGLLAVVLCAHDRAAPTRLALLKVPLAGWFSIGEALLLTSLVVVLVCVLLLARRARDTDATDVRLDDLLHAMPDGVVTVSRDGIILSANTRAERLLGYAAGELVGSPLQGMLPSWSFDPPTRPQIDITPRPEEVTARRKDGTEVRVSVATGHRLLGRPLTVVLRDVTRVRRTEEMLNARDAHLRLIVEQMPAILWTTDRQLRITSTAGAGLAALNLDPREVIGTTMHEALAHPDLDTTPITAHLNALRGESLGYEMEWKGRHFQVRVEPLRDRKKEITGTIGLVLDITDRKHAVGELRDRLRQQQAVARLGQQSLEGLPSDQLLTQSAELVTAALGVDVCEVLEFMPGEEQLRARAGTGSDVRGGPEPATPPESSQAAFTLQAGEPVTVEDLSAETRFRPSQRLLDGRIVSGATVLIAGKQRPFGVLAAYTTRRRAFGPDDLHFLQAVANLLANTLERRRAEEGQQRLTAILEATPDCVTIARTDRRLLYANGTARRLLGKGEKDDVSALSLDSLYGPDALPEFLGGTPRPAGNVWTGEGVLRDHTGREVPVSQVLLAHRSPAGAVEFFSLIARDLAERQRLEEQLRQAQKMEAVGRLAGGIAHDFNNLLCVITGHGDLLRHALPPEQEKWHEHAEEIQKAAERATGLTRQLLAFARKQMAMPRTVDLNVLVGDMERMLRRLIGEDVEFVSELAPTSLLVQGDRGQLEQVFMNLAVNARDAMPRGGRLTITTAYSPGAADGPAAVTAGPHAILTVSDTGCGMSEEVKAHLFEPFFTTKEVGKGTGLGLATVYAVVEQAGGHVEVQSQPEKGTTFRIYLPAMQGRPTQPTVQAAPSEVRHGNETVLLVEDEDGVRSLARQVLRQGGYNVLEARNGEEALTVAGRHEGPLDLLLTDVVMPRLSGSELARRLGPLLPNMRVLFMSGFTDSALVRHDIQRGEMNCLLKPFTPDELSRTVREVLDGTPRPARESSDAPSRAAERPSKVAPTVPAKGTDRRKSPRRKPRRTVNLEILKDESEPGSNLAESLVNLSREGAGVILNTKAELGQETEVVFSWQGRAQAIKLRAEVRWVVPTPDGRFLAGLSFRRPLSYVEFQSLAE